MKKADIERMISLVDDRYIDEIFQDKITGKRRNIFVTFTAVAAALALVAGGISYLVSNAGNADKITADDHIVSEFGIVDYSLYFQNKDEFAMEVEGDGGVLTEATGISCYFPNSESEYLRSVMLFDMSGYVYTDCKFSYNYRDEVVGIMLHANNRTEEWQENVKMLNVEAYAQGELFPHLALENCKSLKRYDVDVYGFDFRKEDNTAGVIFAMDGKEYLISGNFMSLDEIGLIMDSIIENGFWTDRFDLSKAEIKYSDINAYITLEEASMIKPFAGHVPQIYTFGDMTLNDNKVYYSAGRDENNGIVPEWLYFTYFNGSDKDICLQYFTDSSDIKPLGDTVPIDDIDLDKLSEFRHGGNNPTFTIDFGGFKVNVWANCCTDSELLSYITAMRTGASSVVSSSSEEISLAEARKIEPYSEYVPKNDSIGDMRVVSVYYDVSTYIGGEDTAVLVNFMDSRDNHIMLHYGNFKEKVRDKYVPLDEVYDRLESYSEQSEYYADCRYYSFTIDCGEFWIKVSADCTPEEMEQCLNEITGSSERDGVRLSNGINLVDTTLSAANEIKPFAGYIPQSESFGSLTLSAVSEGYFDGEASPCLIHMVYVDNIDVTKQMLTAHFYSDYKAVFLDEPKYSAVPLAELSSEKIKGLGKSFVVDCGDFEILIGASPECSAEDIWRFIIGVKGLTTYDAGDENGKFLTLYDITKLAEKGDDLTWSDFDGYTFTEGGSGLYIKSYAVEGGYNLMIGGEGRETKPTYIYLSDGKGKRIDVRYDSIDEFLIGN